MASVEWLDVGQGSHPLLREGNLRRSRLGWPRCWTSMALYCLLRAHHAEATSGFRVLR